VSRLTSLAGHTGPLPASLTDPENWAMLAFRQPTIAQGREILLQEPGRVIGETGASRGVCYRSHCYAISGWEDACEKILTVSHGAGEDSVNISRTFVDALMPLDSDARFIILHQVYASHRDAHARAVDQTFRRLERAFLHGRMKRVSKATAPPVINIEPVDTYQLNAIVKILDAKGVGREQAWAPITIDVMQCLSVTERVGFDSASATDVFVTLNFLTDKGVEWPLGVHRVRMDRWRQAEEAKVVPAILYALLARIDGFGESDNDPFALLSLVEQMVERKEQADEPAS